MAYLLIRGRLESNLRGDIAVTVYTVFAGYIFTSFAPMAVNWIIQKSFLAKKIGPVAKSAYPAALPVRTAVIMGMFSLTVFSVIVLAGYSVQFEEHSSGYVEMQAGILKFCLHQGRCP